MDFQEFEYCLVDVRYAMEGLVAQWCKDPCVDNTYCILYYSLIPWPVCSSRQYCRFIVFCKIGKGLIDLWLADAST